MKNLRPLPLVLAFAASAMSVSAADAAPDITIEQALKIAQDYLQAHGAAADHQIVGLNLEKATLHTSFWYARWSPAIEADNSRKETGLRIEMDGTLTRFVTAPGGGSELPVGQRPQGARNMR